MTRSIMWFRRDLRLADNPALRHAAERADEVVALFVIDPALWGRAGANRRWFLAGCLETLAADLDGRLVIRHGEPSAVVPELAEEIGADAVVACRDFGPYGAERDALVDEALADVELVLGRSPYAVPPGGVRTQAGEQYKVFTPYYRAWKTQRIADPLPRPEHLALVSGLHHDGIPEAPAVDAELPAPGEAAAWRRLEAFLADDAEDYADERDVPAADATSRLSPYLKFGCIHPRQILDRLDRRKPGHETFAQELAWRDFYAGVLAQRPETAWRAWRDDMATMRVDTGKPAQDKLARWAAGRTGYPIVDAGMRQLLAEGWMHNRLRMIVASFLVKDLHVDWTHGARHFMAHLVDGDIASNNHGWQWVAGTGTDAAPYHRIFNPVRQGERFDPGGDYIRRWVPELASLPADEVHEPWRRPEGPPNGYPAPIVDHATEREEALARYRDR